MSQPLIITLLLFAFALPILGAVVLRLLTPRLAPAQLGGAAGLLLGVVIASVLVLARSAIPSLQIGNLSILLPVTAPDDSFLPAVPTGPTDHLPAPTILTTSAPVTATAALTASVGAQLPAPTTLTTSAPVTATGQLRETATVIAPTAILTPTATAEPTSAPTATPEPTAVPPTAAPPTAIPPTAVPAPPAAQRKYTVQSGDTMLSIAKKFNTTVTAIVKANKLTPQQADSLRVGQVLVIP